MNIKKPFNYLEYFIVFIIIFGNMQIIKFLRPIDNGIFSWPRIIFPNLWILIVAIIWYKAKSIKDFYLSYTYSPTFIRKLAIILSTFLFIQLVFVKATMKESSPVDIYKFIFLSALVPFCEEFFYRGLFFHTALRDVKNWYVAAVIVSFTFAALHLSQGFIAVCILLIFSGLLCYLTHLTKSITCGLLVHICWNALYYNKLLILTEERWIFSLCVIIYMFFITWKSARSVSLAA